MCLDVNYSRNPLQRHFFGDLSLPVIALNSKLGRVHCAVAFDANPIFDCLNLCAYDVVDISFFFQINDLNKCRRGGLGAA